MKTSSLTVSRRNFSAQIEHAAPVSGAFELFSKRKGNCSNLLKYREEEDEKKKTTNKKNIERFSSEKY